MKIGLQIYHFDWPGSPQTIRSKLTEIAKTAETAGFSSIWVMDHFFQLGRGFGPQEVTRIDGPLLESYATISFLSAITQKMNIGALVTGNFYRHPGLLIKSITALDILSGGRAYLGIGAGWYEREARGLGVPFPESISERFKRLEETLQIAKHMWSGNRNPFFGKYYQLEEPINSPQPLSRPHPPIMIGGDGERTLIRYIAKYADAFNFHIGGPVKGFPPYINEWYDNRIERLTRKLDRLREYCKDFGRDFDDIERTVLATIKLSPDDMIAQEVIDLCKELSEIGIQHLIVNMSNTHEITPLDIFANEIIPIVNSY